MTLKGYYNPETSYSIGDVVVFQSLPYVLKEPASAGTPPTRDQEWQRLDQEHWDVIDMVLDGKTYVQELIDEKTGEEEES